MSHSWTIALNLISIVAAAVAALLLYWGSLSVPWKLQTWTGESEVEKRYKRVRSMMVAVCIPCVLIAAICQAAVVLFDPR